MKRENTRVPARYVVGYGIFSVYHALVRVRRLFWKARSQWITHQIDDLVAQSKQLNRRYSLPLQARKNAQKTGMPLNSAWVEALDERWDQLAPLLRKEAALRQLWRRSAPPRERYRLRTERSQIAKKL